MNIVSFRIAAFLFLAWVSALVLNIDIYRKANIELSILGPIVDALLLMLIGLVIFVLVASSSQKADMPKKWVNTSLVILGVFTIFVILFFYVNTFR